MKQFREYEQAAGITERKPLAENAWKKDLRAEFKHIPDAIYELCFQRAWERAHNHGHDAVVDDLLYVVAFAEAVIEASQGAKL